MYIKNLKKYTLHDAPMFYILKLIMEKYQAKLYHDEEITDDILINKLLSIIS